MVEPNGYVAEGLALLDVGIGIFDEDQELVYANPAFRALRRYPEEVCREGVTLEALLAFNAKRGDFGPGDTAELVAERLREIEQSQEREIEREMADGQILRIRFRRLASGGLLVFLDDRTAEHRAQASLALSEERHALVAEAAEEALYEWNIAEEKFFASRRLREMIGREIGDGGQRNWAWEDAIHPDDLEHYRSTLERHQSGEEPRWSCRYRLLGSDGTWRWVSDHGTSLRDERGRAVRMIAAIRDITEEFERDAALAASEERHMLVSRATSDGIYDWNVEEDKLYFSDHLTQLFDFDLGAKGSRIWAARVHPDDIERYIAALVAHFKGLEEAVDCEYRIRGKKGGYRWVHDRGVGVRNDKGRVVRLVGAVRDITDMRAAKADLDRTANQLMSSLATISDGILLVDAENRVQLWNDRYYELFSEAAGGADLSDLIVKGRPFFEMIRSGYKLGMFKPHPGGIDAWVEARKRAWEKPVARWELQLANGTWILLNERRMPDGGHVSVYTDITELKSREEEALAARVRFEEAIEALSSGFALWDEEDRLVVCNSRYRNYFQDLSDIVTIGTPFRQIISAAIERGFFPRAERHKEAFLRETESKRATAKGELREQHLAGGLWLQISDHRTADGGLVSIYTDITELKTKQMEFEAQSEILQLTLENMGQGITLVDRDLKIMALNRKFLELMEFPEDRFKAGFTMEEAFRYNAERGEYGPGDVEEQVRERVELAGQFLPHRFERTRPDGTVLEIVGNPIEGGGFVSTYTDITQLKQREAEIIRAKESAEAALADLQQTQERLIQAEKMASLGHLTAGIAHEIKNPLNFVNNFARLSNDLLEELAAALARPMAALADDLRRDAEETLRTVRENLEKINEHGRRADSIVKNMLLHSREGPSERQSVSVNAIAEEALNLAYHGARAEHPGFNIRIRKSLEPDVGEIDGYPQDLMRVFLNLISNGIYAADKRSSELDGGFAPEIALTTAANGNRVEIEVRDNGVGIPAELRDKIFMPFFTTKPAGQGTGLGLSLSYDIVVNQHGGELTFESEPGAFTAFRVSLPRSSAAPEGAAP